MLHVLHGYTGFLADLGNVSLGFHAQQSTQVVIPIFTCVPRLCARELAKTDPEFAQSHDQLLDGFQRQTPLLVYFFYFVL